MAKIDGVEELARQLTAMGQKTGLAALRKAVRYAFKPVLDDVRNTSHVSKAPHKTYKGRMVAPGYMRRSFVTITTVDKRTGSAIAGIHVKKARRDAWYYMMVAKGWTRPRDNARWPGSDFMTSALSGNRAEIEARLEDRLRHLIAKAAAGGGQ